MNQQPNHSIAKQVASQLDKLGTSQSPQQLTVSLPQGQLDVDLRTTDTLACVLNELTFQAPSPFCSADQLPTVSESLSTKLTYLLEPISPIEFDQKVAVLQMRSSPPSADESSGTTYYEIAASTDKLQLVRYLKKASEPRERTPMTFTRDVICRIAADMTISALAKH